MILGPTGPVVVDWTNARAGDPLFDVAFTWLIAATSEGAGRLEDAALERFLSHFDRSALRSVLTTAAERRLADHNVTERERAAIRSLVARTRQS